MGSWTGPDGHGGPTLPVHPRILIYKKFKFKILYINNIQMTRKFSERSYQYIQGWLKNKYKENPDFKRSQLMTSAVCQLRRRLLAKTDIITLEVLAECYQFHILK